MARVQVSNICERTVGFKIKTTSPEKYRVRPSSGIIKPGDNPPLANWLEFHRLRGSSTVVLLYSVHLYTHVHRLSHYVHHTNCRMFIVQFRMCFIIPLLHYSCTLLLLFFIIPVLLHSITPVLQYSCTSLFMYSITSVHLYTCTPVLHYYCTPVLHYSCT